MNDSVLITDYAWPDLSIERAIIEAAGLRLIAGPPEPASAGSIEEMVRQHQPASILTCWARVSADAVNANQSLRHVGRIGVGLDNIDVASCTARGIPVTNVPDYCVEEVSDHALALTLAWARGVVHFDREVHSGQWQPASAKLRRVSELTIGVVGYGQIGRATVRKFRALGCQLLVHTAHPPYGSDQPRFVELDELLAGSDVVILHLPLLPSTLHIMDADRLARMKSGALLVNVSRGGLVHSEALAAALRSGHLSGAGLDVLETEPLVPSELAYQSNVLLTPHVAFSSTASLAELRRRAAEESVRVLAGQRPRHPCNNVS